MALDRKVHGCKPDAPDERDLRFRKDYLGIGRIRQRLRAVMLPRSVDLRSDPSPEVFDQGEIGSCVDNALATLLGHITNHQPGVGVEVFSRLFMYGNARGWVPEDEGSTLREAVKGVDRYGVPLEALWPYDLRKWQVKPPSEVWDAAFHRNAIEYYRLETLQGMKLCLHEGFPFIFGISVFDSFVPDPEHFTVPLPKRGDRPQGGHALCAMGYDDDRKAFLFRNSWGTSWGDGGHAYLPYEYVNAENLWFDAWTVRSIPA